jgi:hypothetical protein
MIGSTEAFNRLKKEQQKILDFSVLICYAVPNLKKAIKGFEESVPNYESIAKPEYFKEDADVHRLKAVAKYYKENLGKYILIGAFSFIEFYIRDVVDELIAFHGGKEKFISNLQSKHFEKFKSDDVEIEKRKRKLREPLKNSKWEKYKKQISELEQIPDYRHPSELLAGFGLKYFIELVSGSNFKSVLIPDVLENAFGIDLSDKVNKHPELIDKNLRETFDYVRDLRNQIGHGDSGEIGFNKVMDLIRYFRVLAVKVDNHLVKNFFVLERYE